MREGWTYKKLGEVCDDFVGKTTKDNNVRMLPMVNIPYMVQMD